VNYTAIVLAGSRPGRDAFAEQFGTDMKALIPVGGEPMVRRPVRALLGSANVRQVLVLGQAPDRIAEAIPADQRLAFLESLGTIAETMHRLLDDETVGWPLLVTTADHALLDVATVAEFVAGAEGADLAVGVVERDVVMSRFPGTERTWLKSSLHATRARPRVSRPMNAAGWVDPMAHATPISWGHQRATLPTATGIVSDDPARVADPGAATRPEGSETTSRSPSQ
jgi:GTP:adenosylcobinamide-phosphate guanylyltransferase